MTANEIRFNLLTLAQYDKTAAEIMVDFVKDDSLKYEMYLLAFGATNYTQRPVTELASLAKEAAEIMVDFVGTDPIKYQLYTACFNRTTPETDVKSRVNAATDEAKTLHSIFES